MELNFLKTKLREEATCSICLEYYTEPVVLDCGHNFCSSCIARCWKEFPSNTACPQCRKAVVTQNCRPNRPLANMVAVLKQLENEEKEETGERICRKHPEPSQIFFCKEDQVSVCLVCEESEQHRDHSVVPLEEAAQEYKDRFSSCIEVLKDEKRDILGHKIIGIRESEEMMKRIETEKQKTVTECRQLHQFLADQESFLLAKIQSVARDVANKRNAHLCKLSTELFTLQNTIRQMEEKCLQPDKELLQDAEKLLEKCEKRPKFKVPEAFPLELKWGIWELRDLNILLEGAGRHFRGILHEGYQLQEANVTFDPQSAHPQLLLSSDGKSVRWTAMEQDLPRMRKRFEKHFCVLGCQEFTEGRHFWDVTVGGEEEWAVGVATSSVKRTGHFHLTPEAGFFAMGKGAKQYSSPSTLKVNEEIRKIRVSLNYSGGQVVFYDVERARKVFAFTQASFLRETLHPFFWLRGEAQLSLSP